MLTSGTFNQIGTVIGKEAAVKLRVRWPQSTTVKTIEPASKPKAPKVRQPEASPDPEGRVSPEFGIRNLEFGPSSTGAPASAPEVSLPSSRSSGLTLQMAACPVYTANPAHR